MTKLRVLSLFAGIGGFDLGLERAGGFETVAFCEIDPFCRRVLAKHWPSVPCYDDVRELTASRLSGDGIAVDVICGGFPCQAFSSAARGRNNAVDLWPEMRRIISEVRPLVALGENVREKPIKQAAIDLSRFGYASRHRRIRASDIGADHTRERWWLCAHANADSEFLCAFDAEMARLSKVCSGVWSGAYQPQRLRILDGVPNRLDRVGALGNAVVPQIPELIGRAILAARASERLAA